MIRINFNIKIDKPKWIAKMFRCKHEVASVEENFQSRYGSHTSYMMCLKCDRKAMEITENCKHEIDSFGKCMYCLHRITKFDCPHKNWNQEPDTDDYYCDDCGEWKNEL